ncbi:MAG: TIGR03905 family TSCPD domain-containing protein [Oscillospiraceae bacterium]
MHFDYRPHGVCSQNISFDIEDGVIKNVVFMGGCNGNLQGIAKLAEGLTPEQLIEKLEGIRCGFKPTSCPDQFSKAVRKAIGK